MEIDLSKPYIRLYHGGLTPVPEPVPDFHQARFGDFGKGFYTTSNIFQAIKWGYHKLAINDKGASFYVSEYNFKNETDIKIKTFTKPDEE